MDHKEIKQEIIRLSDQLATIMLEYEVYGEDIDQILKKARDNLNDAESLM